MATINLGRVKPVFRGAYDAATAYVIDDIVTYQDETYIAITATTGNLPTVTANWTKLAAKGVDGTDFGTILTTQGDLVYRDGSGLQRLGAGTSGQVLQTGGTGANPSWVDTSGGGIVQFKYVLTSATQSITSQGNPTATFGNMTALSNVEVTITPTSTSNRIYVWTNLTVQHSNTGQGFAGMKEKNNNKYSGIVGDFYHASGSGVSGNLNIHWVDTPSNTSAHRYGAYYGKSHSGADILNNDYYGNNNGIAFIGAMEVDSGIL